MAASTSCCAIICSGGTPTSKSRTEAAASSLWPFQPPVLPLQAEWGAFVPAHLWGEGKSPRNRGGAPKAGIAEKPYLQDPAQPWRRGSFARPLAGARRRPFPRRRDASGQRHGSPRSFPRLNNRRAPWENGQGQGHLEACARYACVRENRRKKGRIRAKGASAFVRHGSEGGHAAS